MRLHEMTLTKRNPDASADLVIPVGLKCPHSHEEMMEFARINSAKSCEWVKALPSHGGKALICGNGPSLSDTFANIETELKQGATIFACNSAAKFFNACGIIPKYQVMLDSQIACKDQIGDAFYHLMASIVHPEVFDLAANPILWHPAMGELAEILNYSEREFSYIGGGITCGNSALCLAHTLGYRDIEVHGMCASRAAGKFHSFPEDSDSRLNFIEVEECGKVYQTTYDYKQQVVVFLKLARLLAEAGSRVQVFGSGLLPDVFNSSTT